MGTITERQREKLRQWADGHMDPETADIFMDSTPPAGWGDVATKQDLEALHTTLAAELHQQTTKLTLAFIAVIVAALAGQTVVPHYFPPPAPPPIVLQVPSP